MFTTNPEYQEAVKKIRTMLEELPFGDILTYDAMSSAAGFPILSRRYAIAKARGEAEENTGSLFEVVRGEGLKRMQSSDLPGVGQGAIRKVRSAAKKGSERLAKIRANDLTPEDASRIVAQRSQLGAIAMIADGRKTVTLSPGSNHGQMPPEDALRALVEGLKK